MKPNLLKIFFFSLIIAALIVPSVSVSAVSIPNPLQYDTFQELINAIINFLFMIALGIAPIMIIIGAFYFVTSAGDPARITTGKQVILYTLIGLLIVFLSKGLIALFQKLF
jgi:hypothetical protein